MRVSRRLAAGFTIVLIFAVIVGIIGINGMRVLRESGVHMYENRMRSLELVYQAMTDFQHMKLDNRRILISSHYDDIRGALESSASFDHYAEDFTRWMRRSREIAEADGIDELLMFHDMIQDLFDREYLPKVRKVNAMGINDIPDHHNRLYINVQNADISNISDRIESLLTGMVDMNTALANQANIDNAWLSQRYLIIQIALLAGAAASGFFVAYLIIKSIAKPIKESERVLGEIASGNFKARIKGNYRGDFKTIKDSINNTAFQLSVYLEDKLKAERQVYEADIEKARVEAATEAVMAGIKYASRIQHNILPSDAALGKSFSDYSVIWKPRDLVGGDVYWMRSFEIGTVLCVCDCTGHGTPGALLTMLVVSAFENIVSEENCHDTAEIIWRLEQKLVSVFSVDEQKEGEAEAIQEGCDLAVLFIGRDGCVTFSSGNIHLFTCDGKEVLQLRGQKIYVGEGRLKGKGDIRTDHILANPKNKFYIASDGLFGQVGGDNGEPYGYREFMRIILEHHNENQPAIRDKVWEAFEQYRGTESRMDDFLLVAFKP